MTDLMAAFEDCARALEQACVDLQVTSLEVKEVDGLEELDEHLSTCAYPRARKACRRAFVVLEGEGPKDA